MFLCLLTLDESCSVVTVVPGPRSEEGPLSLKIYFIQSKETDPPGQSSHWTLSERAGAQLNKGLD